MYRPSLFCGRCTTGIARFHILISWFMAVLTCAGGAASLCAHASFALPVNTAARSTNLQLYVKLRIVRIELFSIFYNCRTLSLY